MKRKRKPVKVRRKPRSVRVIDGAKRERTYLRRDITEESVRYDSFHEFMEDR